MYLEWQSELSGLKLWTTVVVTELFFWVSGCVLLNLSAEKWFANLKTQSYCTGWKELNFYKLFIRNVTDIVQESLPYIFSKPTGLFVVKLFLIPFFCFRLVCPTYLITFRFVNAFKVVLGSFIHLQSVLKNCCVLLLQTTTMKFVALALALLLAVGEKILSDSPINFSKCVSKSCFFSSKFYEIVTFLKKNTLFHFSGSQAAPMMADAPSHLEHIRAAADVYLTQSIASIKNALASLDDAEMT